MCFVIDILLIPSKLPRILLMDRHLTTKLLIAAFDISLILHCLCLYKACRMHLLLLLFELSDVGWRILKYCWMQGVCFLNYGRTNQWHVCPRHNSWFFWHIICLYHFKVSLPSARNELLLYRHIIWYIVSLLQLQHPNLAWLLYDVLSLSKSGSTTCGLVLHYVSICIQMPSCAPSSIV